MRQLALIRHPAVAGATGLCYGRLDLDIADPAEIARIAAKIPFRPDRVVSSPSRRCRTVADAIPCARLTIDPRLQELDFGQWEGRAWDVIDRAELDRWGVDPRHHAPPGGETGQTLIDRVAACFADIVATDGPLAIVTHGGPLKILCCLTEGVPIDLFRPPPLPGSVIVASA